MLWGANTMGAIQTLTQSPAKAAAMKPALAIISVAI
jgi:hypothetical protein